MFRFFTKIQKRIIDPNDPQQRWILRIISHRILWIHDPTRFFTTDPTASGDRLETIFEMHTSDVCLHCSSLRPFLNPRHELNDPFYPFYRCGKIAIQT